MQFNALYFHIVASYVLMILYYFEIVKILYVTDSPTRKFPFNIKETNIYISSQSKDL